jgi:hypothetical protein
MEIVLHCNEALHAADISELDPLTTHSVSILNRVFRETAGTSIVERAIDWYHRTYLPVNGPVMNCEYVEVLERYICNRLLSGGG